MGFGGLITGLGIAGFAALAGGISLGGVGVVSVCVLSCRGSVVCSVFCSASGAGIFGFITGRGITGFAIGLLTGGCSGFVSGGGAMAEGISAAAEVSLVILSSATGFGFIIGLGITGFAMGLLTGACSGLASAGGAIAEGISVAEAVSFFICSSVTGFGFITGFGIIGLAAAGLAGDAGNVSAGVVSDDGDGAGVGSLGFIIGRATTGLGCSVSVLSTEVSTLLTDGVAGNFVSIDFKTSGNASIAC